MGPCEYTSHHKDVCGSRCKAPHTINVGNGWMWVLALRSGRFNLDTHWIGSRTAGQEEVTAVQTAVRV
jgi:hypothetical protein